MVLPAQPVPPAAAAAATAHHAPASPAAAAGQHVPGPQVARTMGADGKRASFAMTYELKERLGKGQVGACSLFFALARVVWWLAQYWVAARSVGRFAWVG